MLSNLRGHNSREILNIIIIFFVSAAHAQECVLGDYSVDNSFVDSHQSSMKEFRNAKDNGLIPEDGGEYFDHLDSRIKAIPFNKEKVLSTVEIQSLEAEISIPGESAIASEFLSDFFIGVLSSIEGMVNTFQNPDATDLDKSAAALSWLPVIGELLGFIDQAKHEKIKKQHIAAAKKKADSFDTLDQPYVISEKEIVDLQHVESISKNTISVIYSGQIDSLKSDLLGYYDKGVNKLINISGAMI